MLELGVIRQAAKRCKIPLGTAIALNRKLEADPTYVQDRSDLRERVLPDLEAKLIALSDRVVERIAAPDLTPKQLAGIAVDHDLKSFTYQNPKPQYLKGLVDLYKAIGGNRKAAETPGGDDGAGHVPAEVTINIRGPGGVTVTNAVT